MPLLQRVLDIDGHAWRAICHAERCRANDPLVRSVNSNFAVDLVLDVGGGERWAEFQFHCLGKIPYPLWYAMAKSIFNQKKLPHTNP